MINSVENMFCVVVFRVKLQTIDYIFGTFVTINYNTSLLYTQLFVFRVPFHSPSQLLTSQGHANLDTHFLSPFTSPDDRSLISPYKINTKTITQLTRIRKLITKEKNISHQILPTCMITDVWWPVRRILCWFSL